MENILNKQQYVQRKSLFGTFKRDKLEIEFKYDKNLQYSFGHMTILNPKIEEGYVTGTAFDKYDFNYLYKDYAKDSRTTVINNTATGYV